MYLITLLMVSAGLYTFCSKRKHILLMLLSIEFLVLSFFFYIFYALGLNSLYFSLLFLTFTVCEGALGLGLLISVSRVYGGDYMGVFNF